MNLNKPQPIKRFKILGFVVYDTLNISNLGGTITVHLFAAVYAIALSKMLFKPKDIAGNKLLATNYTSDGLGTIGKGSLDQAPLIKYFLTRRFP